MFYIDYYTIFPKNMKAESSKIHKYKMLYHSAIIARKL